MKLCIVHMDEPSRTSLTGLTTVFIIFYYFKGELCIAPPEIAMQKERRTKLLIPQTFLSKFTAQDPTVRGT